MNDIEVLGLNIQNYSQFKSKENNNDEMIEKIEKINQHHDNYQKYHITKPLRTEEYYDKELSFYIVEHDFGQLDWMGYGYREKTYITSKDEQLVKEYCEKHFGKNKIALYYNIKYDKYKINKVNIKEYLIQINKILNDIKQYEDLPCINNNWQSMGVKICVSNGIPLQMKNGEMTYEGRGEIERYYQPKQLNEISL